MDRGCIIEEATGVGAVLMQTAAFMSKKKLNKCQRQCTVTQKERHAAVLEIKKFRAYV